MLSTKKTKTPDHYPCGHMRGPGWHDWRACLTKQGVEEASMLDLEPENLVMLLIQPIDSIKQFKA